MSSTVITIGTPKSECVPELQVEPVDNDRSWPHFHILAKHICSLLMHTQYVDMVLMCEGRSFSTHRVIVSAYSKVIDSTLREIMGDENQDLATMNSSVCLNLDELGIKATSLQLLLNFMYSGQISDELLGTEDIKKAISALDMPLNLPIKDQTTVATITDHIESDLPQEDGGVEDNGSALDVVEEDQVALSVPLGLSGNVDVETISPPRRSNRKNKGQSKMNFEDDNNTNSPIKYALKQETDGEIILLIPGNNQNNVEYSNQELDEIIATADEQPDDLPEYPSSLIKRHTCLHCNKVFDKKARLTSHIRTHTKEKAYLCTICGKGLAHLSSYKAHLRGHSGEKPYVCEYCDKAFNTQKNRKEHERVHTGEKPYQCDHCGKTFRRQYALKVHTFVHTGEKPYKCEVCHKRFRHSSHLLSHKRIHSGEKPYQCPVCEKWFCYTNVLKAHITLHTTDLEQVNAHLEESKLRRRQQGAGTGSPLRSAIEEVVVKEEIPDDIKETMNAILQKHQGKSKNLIKVLADHHQTLKLENENELPMIITLPEGINPTVLFKEMTQSST